MIVVEQNPKMPLTEYHVHNLEEIRWMTLQVGAAGYHNARPVQVQSPKVFRTVGSKCNYEWHANPWKLPEIHGNYQKLPTPKLEHKMPTHVGMTKCPHKQLHVASIITDIQIYTSVYKNMETLPNNEDIFLYNLRKQTLNTSRCLNKLTRNVVSLFFFSFRGQATKCGMAMLTTKRG